MDGGQLVCGRVAVDGGGGSALFSGMTHAHFYLPADQWQAGSLVLTGEEAKHCRQVTRHREGDTVIVFDGRGRKAETRIMAMTGSEVRVEITSLNEVPAVSCPITLVQGIVKGDTMEWIIEKAVELGVQRIVPVLTQRTIVRLDGADAVKKQAKWQRIALEACKQCGQAWLPEVAVPCSLEAAVKKLSTIECRLTASLQADAVPLQQIVQKAAPSSAALAIGPEGDFSEPEYARLHSAGWRPWSLGQLTLRSETAAICALSILRYELASH